jgi:hypothetical protein
VGVNDIRELEEYQDLKGPKELLDQGIEVYEITTAGVPTKIHVRYFLSSDAPGEDLGKQKRAAGAIRGHWGVENRNHYRRDASKWREDAHRRRKVKGAQNLALMRNALLAIIPFDEKTSLDKSLGDFANRPAKALNLILHARPI